MKLKWKVLCVTVLLAFTLCLVAGCGGNQDAGDKDQQGQEQEPQKAILSIATGGTGGTYYPVGGGISEILNKHSDGKIVASAESTAASVENMRLLKSKQNDLAVVQADIALEAYEGKGNFNEKIDVKGIMSLYPTPFQIVTMKDSPVGSFLDIKGKRVICGAPGSGQEALVEKMLKAFDMTWDDIKPLHLSYTEGTKAMKDGKADVLTALTGIPGAAITELATVKNIKVVPFTDEEIKTLMEADASFSEMTVPKGAYRGVESDIPSIGLYNVLVARGDLEENVVYDMLDIIFGNVEEFRAVHNAVRNISVESAQKGMSIPFHPGAKKFYDEH